MATETPTLTVYVSDHCVEVNCPEKGYEGLLRLLDADARRCGFERVRTEPGYFCALTEELCESDVDAEDWRAYLDCWEPRMRRLRTNVVGRLDEARATFLWTRREV
jgi:hypothetical protein